VDVPLGTTTMRIYVDKGWDILNFAGGKGTKVYAGWSLNSSPGAVASGSVTSAKENGDVMLTIDVTGSIGKYWILIESENDADAFVSAVAYDIAQRPRVSVELGKRTGVVAVEAGASQIYRMQLPANVATTVKVNIDAGWFGTIGEQYDIFVNILDDKKIEMITDNLSLTSIIDFLNKLSSAFKTGKVDALFPKFLTPDENTNDLTRTGHVANFGMATFPVSSSKQAPIVYVAIKPKSALPWSGQLSSFTVAFSTTETPANDKVNTASCENPKRRRSVDDVEQGAAADPCASKTCDACVSDTTCQYCYGKSVTSNACRSKSAGTCPTDSAAATKAQCTECVKLESNTCGANANCKYCSQLSAGDVVEHCINAWLCPADNTAATGSPPSGSAGTSAGVSGSTTAGVSQDATAAASFASLSVAVASTVAALLLSL
jgi:hypothetical protein